MSSLKTLREILDQKISDKKQLDIKTWKKAINIATAKSKKPKDMWSRRAMRYQNAVDNFEIIECGKILNETKIHFQGSKKLKKSDDGFHAYAAFFLFAAKQIAICCTYHNNQGTEMLRYNLAWVMAQVNVDLNVLDLETHGYIIADFPPQSYTKN